MSLDVLIILEVECYSSVNSIMEKIPTVLCS